MRRTALLALAAGLILLLALVLGQGPAGVLAALAVAGWAMLWVLVYHVVPLVLDTVGWGLLMTRPKRPGAGVLLLARWVAESINSLLPVAQVGGHLVRARLATGRGCPGRSMSLVESGASVAVDFTLGVLTQFVFVAAGLLAALPHMTGMDRPRFWVGVALGALLLAGFVLVQRAGMFTAAAQVLQGMFRHRRLSSLMGGARAMDEHMRVIYAARGRLAASAAVRLLGWLSKAGESWLTLYLLGVRISLGDTLILEALSTAATSAAFFVPGGLGVREGSILLVGGMLGVPPDAALALALVKRGREIMFGVPGIVAWLWAEGRNRLDARRKDGELAGERGN